MLNDKELEELKRKAALFDWLATRLDEAKLQLNFGGSDWIYPNCSPESLEEDIIRSQGFENLPIVDD